MRGRVNELEAILEHRSCSRLAKQDELWTRLSDAGATPGNRQLAWASANVLEIPSQNRGLSLPSPASSAAGLVGDRNPKRAGLVQFVQPN